MDDFFETHTLLRTLGKGRLGTVKLYKQSSEDSKATDLSSYKAVKVIKRNDVQNSSMASRIFNEKKALMVVEPNPYTLSLGGTSKDSEHLYFIMSPILAGPIHKHFRAEGNGRFAYTRARFYCMNVTSALLFMHGKGEWGELGGWGWCGGLDNYYITY